MQDIPDASLKKSVVVASTADIAASTRTVNVLTGYSPTVSLNVTTTASSATATTTSTAGIKVGAVITGNVNITDGTTVLSITNATTFVMSVVALTAGTTIATTFTQTITALAMDGYTLLLNDRVLLKDQTTVGGINTTANADNGIYSLTTLGTAAVPWVLTRTPDADSISEICSAFVAVDRGTVNGGRMFDNDLLITNTLGTTAMPWNRIADSGTVVTYNGTTAAAGMFDGGTTTPTATNRLNYGGYFYPTQINLVGTADTATAATHYYIEQASDGFLRPKTLANVKTEIVTSAAVIAGLGYTPSNLTNGGTMALGITGAVLGNTSNTFRFESSPVANTDRLEVFDIRTAAGSDWTTSGFRMQNRVDATYQAYIQFNGSGNQGGISIGTGGSSVGPLSIVERLKIDSNGVSTFSGNLFAPTASPGTNNTQVATTAYVQANSVGGTGGDGRVAFWDGITSQSSDNAFRWDNVNKRFALGTSTPVAKLHVIDTNGGFFFDGTHANYNRIKSTGVASSTGRDLLFSAQASGTTPDLVISDSGNIGFGTLSPLGKVDIYTGLSGITSTVGLIPFGTISFINAGSSTTVPLIMGRSNDSVGLSLQAGTNNSNALPDMGFDIRENDNSDYLTLTTSGFRFSRFGISLIDILRNGNTTFVGSVFAPTATVGTNNTQVATTAYVQANSYGGTGTTNYLQKITGALTLGNSTILDTGTSINLGSQIIIDSTSSTLTTSSSAIFTNLGPSMQMIKDPVQYDANSSTNQTGAVIFKHAPSAIATMFDVRIKVYNYGSGISNLINFSFYFYTTTNIPTTGMGVSNLKTDSTSIPFQSISAALDASGNVCIIVGSIGTVWSPYNKVTIEEIKTSFTGGTHAGWRNGWTASLVTDISTYTTVQTLTLNDVMLNEVTSNFDTITGTGFIEASANTITGQPVAGQWGNGIQLSTNHNNTYAAQLVFSLDGSWRVRHKSGASFNAWATLLKSDNFNSYAPTLTGGGASGTWGIAVTGNAASATVLQTARTINGVSFNGSANITINAVDATARLPLTGGTLTGALAGTTASFTTITGALSGNATTASSSSFLLLNNGVSIESITTNGIYREETPSSTYNYTTTLNMNSGDGRQQLTIERSGGGIKYRGNATASGTAGWSAWKTVLASDNYTTFALASTRGDGTLANDLGVAQQLRWKNYGQGHTIFDASAGTAPNGTSINNANSSAAWIATYPTLMGWNGTSSYGVRVDSARVADSAGSASNSGTVNMSAGRTDATAYPVVWGVASGVSQMYSCTAVNITSSTGTLSATNLTANVGGGYSMFLSLSNYWAGQGYPTLTGSAAEKWVMHVNPHICYVANGSNGYAGSMAGATIRFGSDASATFSWDVGVGVASLGADRFGIGRQGAALLNIDSIGTVNTKSVTTQAVASAGYGLWGTSPISYGILMATSADTTYGGRMAGETTSDYNMYFTMAQNTNRGFVFRNSYSTPIFGIHGNGVRASADIIAYSTSDRRLKDNLIKIQNPIQKLSMINGYMFDWNNKQDTYTGRDTGVIAQEIEMVMPEVITTRENGYKAVKYDKLVPLLIEVAKEQQATIESQAKEILEMKKMMQEILNKLK